MNKRIKKFMCKSFILSFIALIQASYAMEEKDVDSYLQNGGKAKHAPFKNVTSYMEWVQEKNLKKTLIIGSGRVENSNYESASALYGDGRQYNYFLIDNNPARCPDMVGNVENLDLQDESYDCIIFENLPMDVSFTPKVVASAFKILRKGGKLVISSFPRLTLEGKKQMDISNYEEISKDRLHISISSNYEKTLNKDFQFLKATQGMSAGALRFVAQIEEEYKFFRVSDEQEKSIVESGSTGRNSQESGSKKSGSFSSGSDKKNIEEHDAAHLSDRSLEEEKQEFLIKNDIVNNLQTEYYTNYNAL